MKEGVITYKFAAHAADLAKVTRRHGCTTMRSVGRGSISAGGSGPLALDPETAEDFHDRTLPAEGAKVATSVRCGPVLLDEDHAEIQTWADQGSAEMSEKFGGGQEIYRPAGEAEAENRRRRRVKFGISETGPSGSELDGAFLARSLSFDRLRTRL